MTISKDYNERKTGTDTVFVPENECLYPLSASTMRHDTNKRSIHEP
ncbi:MAG: hypothetical protein QG656_1877 [Candidatus Hydrogenedentes bacterium]|nr:hypothetical protein [Candidatus Hydrogenedentota bacterium]